MLSIDCSLFCNMLHVYNYLTVESLRVVGACAWLVYIYICICMYIYVYICMYIYNVCEFGGNISAWPVASL